MEMEEGKSLKIRIERRGLFMGNQEEKGMSISLKLPVGIESFEEIRTKGFYYVDKTGLIKELLNNWGR